MFDRRSAGARGKGQLRQAARGDDRKIRFRMAVDVDDDDTWARRDHQGMPDTNRAHSGERVVDDSRGMAWCQRLGAVPMQMHVSNP